jgi:hypothetical protein
MRKLTLLTALSSALLFFAPATAAAAPALDVTATTMPGDGIPRESSGQYLIAISNTGDAPTVGALEVDLSLPPGLEATAVTDQVDQYSNSPMVWDCSIAPDALSVSCAGPEDGGTSIAIDPGEEACEGEGLTAKIDTCRIVVTVTPSEALFPGPAVTPTVEACGGGAPSCDQASLPTEILPPVIFDLTHFDGGVFDAAGEAQTQAASHPHSAFTHFNISTIVNRAGQPFPFEDLRDTTVELPPGLVGNPQAVRTCEIATFLDSDVSVKHCPDESQVGVLTLFAESSNIPGASEFGPHPYLAPIYNLRPPRGTVVLLGFQITGLPFYISAKLRSGEDYGVTAGNVGAPPTVLTSGARVEVWGAPADPSHDAFRGNCLDNFGHLTGKLCPSADADEPRAFFTLPTSCVGPVETPIEVSSYAGSRATDSFISHDNAGNPVGNTGCENVPFEPTLTARPTTDVADAPSGLDVDLHIPQEKIDDPEELAQAHLKDTTVTLPESLVLNPAGANGLEACSPEQIGLTSPTGATPHRYTPAPPNCPEASKVARAEVQTPLLEHPLPGAVYLAEPHRNPFGSLLALYLVVDDPRTGIVVKLAGEVNPDPATGRISSTFKENPQLPFEDLSLDFFGGARGALRTPPTCGTYSTQSTLTPWSGTAPVSVTDSYEIKGGPGGGACASSRSALPHSPAFDAGTLEPLAGRHSPLVINLRREDGSQNFSSLTLTPPPGLTAKLAGAPPCSDADLATAAAKAGRSEQTSPSCPAASRVGSVYAAAGAGPAPYWAQGEAYLAGPYKGAPLSLAILTPAVAGPFDLGTIVVRTALHVDPRTAQITAKADPIPHILEGIPLDVRAISVRLDKPQFTLNPTSCDPFGFDGSLLSTLGATAPLHSRFQVAECGRLGFKPRLAMRLKGGTKRGENPRLIATLTTRPGDANIAGTQVTLPRSAFLDQGHIRTICTRVQWAADACPKGSIYGRASATSPLVDYPLAGSVYLRSSDNKLPDVVADLRGPAHQPIRIEVVGRTDSVKGALRSTFDVVPDAPASTFRLELFGGNRGLVVNSRDICARDYRAKAVLDAHNGLRRVLKPALRNGKCAKAKRGKRKSR